MQPHLMQTISSVGGGDGEFNWGLLVAGIAAFGALLSPIVYWVWSKRFARIQKQIHAWQKQQRSPEALLVQAHIERLEDAYAVEHYPGHIPGHDPSTGFKVIVQLNNPGDVPIHVLHTRLVLEGTMFTGWLDRKFRSASEHGLIPPHSLKDFFLFAADDQAAARDEWPAVRFLIEYVSGSVARDLELLFAAPDVGLATGRVPLSVISKGEEEAK